MYQYQCLKPREQQRLQPELIPDASVKPWRWYQGRSSRDTFLMSSEDFEFITRMSHHAAKVQQWDRELIES